MPDNLEPIGIQAIAEGVGSFLSAMKQMEDAFDRTSTRLDGFAPASGAATASIAQIAGGVTLAVGGLSLLSKAFETVTSVIQSTVSAIYNFMGESMNLAGRFQEMEIAALAVGRTMGLQEGEIRGAIESYKELGIRSDIASKTAASFARNQVDLAKGTELVRIAQGAAIMMGEDSSATMERLTWAVTTHNTRMMRYMGIMVDFEAAQERWAKANDRTTESLTQVEKNMIAVEESIRAGASVAGIYEEAMKSPTKAMRSLTEREIPELKAAIGAPFLQAWATVVNAVREFVQALTAAVSEGGSLYPVLVNVGAALSILADQFSAALGWVTDFVTGLSVDLGGGLGDIAVNMLTWGANIVASLAEGVIGAASTVLVEAMNFVGDVLTAWLGPGSPPKAAPGLIKWGTAAMAEYLRGFTEADFSVLEKIQAPLRQILEGPAFADISAEMIKAISIGEVDETLFQKIAASAGEFGAEIARLAQLQFELAAANEAVARSEKGMLESRQRAADLTRQYNAMLRAGAPKEALDMKLAEVKAAEEAAALAQEQNAEAKKRVGSLEEQAGLQEKLVGQLVGLGKAAMPPTMAAVVAAAARAAAGIKVPKAVKLEEIVPELVMPEAATWDISSRISDAIDRAKAVIQEKMAGIWQPFVDAWERLKAGPLAEIGPRFLEVWGLVQQAWDDFWAGFSPAWEGMKADLATFWEETQPELKKAWEELGDVWFQVAGLLRETLIPTFLLLNPTLDLSVEAWGALIGVITRSALQDILRRIAEQVDNFRAACIALRDALIWIRDKIDLVNRSFEDFSRAIGGVTLPDWLTPGSVTPFEIGIWGILNAVRELSLAGQGFFLFQRMRADLDALMLVTVPAFVSTIVFKFTELKYNVLLLVTEMTDRVVQMFCTQTALVMDTVMRMCNTVMVTLVSFRDALGEILDQIAKVFEEMAQRVGEAIGSINVQIAKLVKELDRLIEKAREAKKAMEKAGLMGKSPSRLELGLRGALEAMQQMSRVEMPRLASAARQPALAYAPQAGGPVTVNVGPVYLSGPMDMAQFEQSVELATVRALRRRG